MKALLPALLLLCASVFAQEMVPLLTTSVERTVTIKLGGGDLIFGNAPWIPPVRYPIITGSKVRIEPPAHNATDPVVVWYKDGAALASAGPVLEITAASPSDAGSYEAVVAERANPTRPIISGGAVLVVTTGSSSLVNVSQRAHVNPQNRAVLSGFVIDQAGATSLLVRAVGPALGSFGIGDPLAQPRLRIVNAQGLEILPAIPGNIPSLVPTTASNRIPEIPARLGAFPLPADSTDIERMYHLNPGIYTAEVTSGDGGSGTVLLEIYQYR